MPLSFRPACLPIAHSGLPHTSSSLALGLLMTAIPGIPSLCTWPYLPKYSFREQRFVQSAAGFPGLVVDTIAEQVFVDRADAEQGIDGVSLAYLTHNTAIGALTSEYASGLTRLLHIPSGWLEGVAIKSQLVGPISLALYITDEQQRPLLYDPVLREALAQHLSLRSAWLSTQLSTLTEHVMICLDEPFLDAFNSPFFPIDWDRGIELLEIVFSGVTGCRGVMIGNGSMSSHGDQSSAYWAPILETSVDMLMFDVYNHSAVFLDGAHLLPRFLDMDGSVIWGLIPSNAEALHTETTDTLVVRFQTMLHLLTKAGVSQDQLLQASLISTDGSLEHLSVKDAEHALQLCSSVSTHIRLSFGLEERGKIA